MSAEPNDRLLATVDMKQLLAQKGAEYEMVEKLVDGKVDLIELSVGPSFDITTKVKGKGVTKQLLNTLQHFVNE